MLWCVVKHWENPPLLALPLALYGRHKYLSHVFVSDINNTIIKVRNLSLSWQTFREHRTCEHISQGLFWCVWTTGFTALTV